MSRRAAHVLSLSFVAAAAATGCSTTTLTVRVIDASTGEPLQRVHARLHASSEDLLADVHDDRDLGPSAADGRIVLPGLADRMNNYADVSAPGYADAFVEYWGRSPLYSVFSPADAAEVPSGRHQQWESHGLNSTATIRPFRHRRPPRTDGGG